MKVKFYGIINYEFYIFSYLGHMVNCKLNASFIRI